MKRPSMCFFDSHMQAEQEEWAAERRKAAAEAATVQTKLGDMQAALAASRRSQVGLRPGGHTCQGLQSGSLWIHLPDITAGLKVAGCMVACVSRPDVSYTASLKATSDCSQLASTPARIAQELHCTNSRQVHAQS